jgi:hypothetical protein
MGTQAARTDVVISIREGHSLEDVVEALRRAGLSVDESLPEVGVVKGSTRMSNVSALASLAGVQAVEGAREVRLPPPESPVQ